MQLLRIFALAATLCASFSAFSLQPPAPGDLHEKEFRHAELWWGNVYRPVRELSDDLTLHLVPELGTLDVHPDRAFLDLRTGRWGTLILTRPMIPGPGVRNELEWTDLGRTAPRGPEERNQAASDAFVAFLTEFRDELGIDPRELARPRVAAHEQRLVQIHIPRQRDGVPVRDSYITASINSGNLVLMGQRNWGAIGVDTRPSLSQGEAEGVLRQHLGEHQYSGFREPPRLELVPVSGQPDVSQVTRVGGGLHHRLVWVLTPDFPREISNWEALVDAHDGQLLAFEDTNHYHSDDEHHHNHLTHARDEHHHPSHGAGPSRRVSGGIYPIGADGEPPDGVLHPNYPVPFTNVSLDGNSIGTTTTGGNAPPGTGPGSLSTSLVGPFVSTSDNCGAVNVSSQSGDLDLGESDGTDCAVPDGTSAGNTNAARTTFYGLNRIIEQAQGYLPDNNWLQSPLVANLNINLDCNASYSGQVNFFTSGGGCRNTGEVMAVVHHEWGHGMDDHSVNPGVSRPGEGIADIYAQNMLNDSCIGRGFRESEMCTGFGDPCLECTGVRDSDWAKRQSGQPHDIEWVISACGSGGGGSPCGGSVHCEGTIVAEAVWDLVHRDLQGFEGSSFDLDSHTALELGTRLTYMGAGPVGDWYQCNPDTSEGGGCNADSGYLQYLAADADNGSIEDGTPHMSAIHAAFARHQLSCDTPPVQDSGCANGPASAPQNVSAMVFNEGVQLTWDPVDNASEYWIYRTESPKGCDFGKTRVGRTTETTFTETGLRNDFEVHYNVVAAGATDACTSLMSACQAVIPEMGPSGILEGTVVRGGSGAPLEGVAVQAQGDVTFHASTDEDGLYSMMVVEGTYDVTGSRPGFESTTVTDVEIEEDATISIDLVLHAASASIAPDAFDFSVAQNSAGLGIIEIASTGTRELEWSVATDAIDGGFVSARGFEGDFDLGNWELVNTPSGVNGSVNFEDGPPAEVYVVGGNSGTGGATDFQVEVPVDGEINFDWGYQTEDSDCWDSGGYAINGIFTQLACNSEAVPFFGQSESIPVSAGDVFAIRVETEDGQLGAGTMGITSFHFSPDICSAPEDVPWLSVEPDAGTTPPGSTDRPVLLVDTGGLDIGDYEAYVCVSTNEPENPEITIPVFLNVNDDPPGDLSLDAPTVDFGDVLFTSSASASIQVSNIADPGASVVTLSGLNLSSGAEVFEVVNGDCRIGTVLAPEETCTLEIRFSPLDAVLYEGTLEIGTAEGQSRMVELTGQGIAPENDVFEDRFEALLLLMGRLF